MAALVAFVILILVPIFPASGAAAGLLTNGPLQESVLGTDVGFCIANGVSVVFGKRGKGVGLGKSVGLGTGVSVGTKVGGIAPWVIAYIVLATASADACT